MKLILFKIQRKIGRYPTLYFPLYSLFGKKKYLAVEPGTDIVIEGFPRSANTFAVVAFEKAQEQTVSVAHHLHVPSQVLRAVKLGIPVIVLIREPVAAICSLVVREPHLDLKTALNDYINFYNTIIPVSKNFVTARFEDVTSDFGEIIKEVNAKFSTNFSEFNHKLDSVNDVFASLDSLEEDKKSGTVNEAKVSRPSTQRNNLAQSIAAKLNSKKYSKHLKTANNLHMKFCDLSNYYHHTYTSI